MEKKRYLLAFSIIIIILFVLSFLNLYIGSVKVQFDDIISACFFNGTEGISGSIIMSIRLPRILSALLLGGALSLSGYLLQTFFDNPIVGPFVLGISSGAKLTVALTMVFLLKNGLLANSMLMVVSAFVGSLISMGFVLLISFRVRRAGILVVCGIMIGYICSAICDFVITFADDSNIVNLHNWSLGSLSGISIGDVKVILVFVILCLLAVLLMQKPIGAYRLGENYAESMGVNIRLLRVMLIITSSLLSAVVTAFAGPISFVGIAVPHMAKQIIKTTRPALMIPCCFILGSVVTLFCDGIARTVFAPTEMSISSVTAALLVPVVIVMMIKKSEKKI